MKKEIRFTNLSVYEDQFLSDTYPLDILLEEELKNEISTAIEKLPHQCKSVFEMSRLENKGYKEIADNMKISVNTVKYHIKNALSSIRLDVKSYIA